MNHSQQAERRLSHFLAIVILLLGLAVRAVYLRQSFPYVDEYFTILAAKAIQQHGYPILPSGLFYTHGLLYTYLIALMSWPMIFLASSVEIMRGELLYQLPNLLISGLALAMTYTLTRRWFGWPAGLVAMGLLALYPYGIVWGARVRMYTLLFFFVPLLTYLFYRLGTASSQRRPWVYALLGLLLGVLVHNWVTLLVPLLVLGAGGVAWGQGRVTFRDWQRWLSLLLIIGLMVGFAAYLQSLSMDLPETSTQQPGWSQGIVTAIRERINLFDAIGSNGDLLKEFIWQNPFNLLIVASVLLGVAGLAWLFRAYRQHAPAGRYFWPMVYLYLLFGGAVAEILLLIDPELKQPRYVAPLMGLAFIIAAGWFGVGLHIFTPGSSSPLRLGTALVSIPALLLVFGLLSNRQLPQLFFEGLPAVAYNKAFQFVRATAMPTDAVLTPLPAAAALYLDNPIYFAAQNATYNFVQTNTQGMLADRWLGAPWLSTPQQFKETLRAYETTWLVTDQFSFNTQFDSGWKQLLRYNTARVWEEDGIIIFRGQGLVRDIPTEPEVKLQARLDEAVELVGYTRQLSAEGLKLYLFWRAVTPLPADYTTFVHLRNGANTTVAQTDVQPLDGQYPTSRWRVGELVVDEVEMPLPPELSPDHYRLLVGLYRWDTLERLPVVNDASGENAVELEAIELK